MKTNKNFCPMLMKCEHIQHFQSDFEYEIGARLATIDLNGITMNPMCIFAFVCASRFNGKIKMREKKNAEICALF